MAGLVTDALRNEWNNYWANSKAGDTGAWGNGTVTRNADGSATYKSNGGTTTNFNAGMSIDDFAKSSTEIGNVLSNQYGYQADKPATVFQPVTAAVQSATASQRTVGDNELVSSQLNKLLATDSPYLQQARNKAMQTANGRGLVNSSLAAGWGESAAIDAAMPIASADAGAHTTAARDNQSAQNSVSMANAQAANQAAQTAANMQMQAQLQQIGSENAQRIADRQYAQSEQSRKDQNTFSAGQQDKQAAFQHEQLRQNMNLAYDKLTLDQTNAYANGYMNIVNSNMLAEDKSIALSNYSLIYGFADGYQPTTGVDMSVLPAAQSTVNSYWANGKAGDTGAWGGGQIVNNGNGTATYTTKDGRTVSLNKGMSLADLAAADSEIGANLKNLYGYGG